MFSFLLYVLAMVALLLSFSRDRGRTKKALAIARKVFLNIFPPRLAIIGLIGLVLAVTEDDSPLTPNQHLLLQEMDLASKKMKGPI